MLDDTYNEQCQAGTLVNYVNGVMSHTPAQPDDMSDELYNLGKTGAYTAMYSFDCSHTVSSAQTVVWPAQNMPTEYFDENYPWSISSDEAFSNPSITLTCNEDGEEWNFSSDAADGYFNYNSEGYGQSHCLIFCPDNMDAYYAGDTFTVQVKENDEVTLEYTVTFFDLETEETHLHNFVEVSRVNATCTKEGTICLQCEGCGESGTETIEANGHTSGDWIVDKAATYAENGTRHKECVVCKTVLESEEIARLEEEDAKAKLEVQVGDEVTYSGHIYLVHSNTSKSKEVTYRGPENKKIKKVGIPKTIQIGDDTYKVTAIEKNAFSKCTKLKSVTIPSSVKKIGAKAFYNCKNLKKITIQSKNLKSSTIGKKCIQRNSQKGTD